MIGGSLSHPHERFPKAFPGSFWKDYPYFLPCLVGASYVLFTFLITFVMLKEVGASICITSVFCLTIEWFQTRPAHKSQQPLREYNSSRDHSNDKPLPLQKLLVYPVIISIANHAILAFLNISTIALLPLFLSMPLDIGGLNLSPPTIGYIIGTFGITNATFQGFFLNHIVHRWGNRNVFIAAISTFIPIFLIFPVINFVAVGWGQWSLGVWILLGLLITLLTLADMAYGIFISPTFILLLMTNFIPRGHFYFHYRFRS